MLLKAIYILEICIVVLFSTTANAQQNMPYFSNKDIEKYKSPSDNKTPKTKSEAVETKRGQKKQRSRRKRILVKRATEYKEIEKVQQEVEEIEEAC